MTRVTIEVAVNVKRFYRVCVYSNAFFKFTKLTAKNVQRQRFRKLIPVPKSWSGKN